MLTASRAPWFAGAETARSVLLSPLKSPATAMARGPAQYRKVSPAASVLPETAATVAVIAFEKLGAFDVSAR